MHRQLHRRSLYDIAVFIKESFTRVSVWETESQDKRHKCISPIGETRWWAKHDALRKVLGNYGRPHGGLFVEVVSKLSAIMKHQMHETKPEDTKMTYSDMKLCQQLSDFSIYLSSPHHYQHTYKLEEWTSSQHITW